MKTILLRSIINKIHSQTNSEAKAFLLLMLRKLIWKFCITALKTLRKQTVRSKSPKYTWCTTLHNAHSTFLNFMELSIIVTADARLPTKKELILLKFLLTSSFTFTLSSEKPKEQLTQSTIWLYWKKDLNVQWKQSTILGKPVQK